MLKNRSWPIKESNPGIHFFFNFLNISLKQGGALSLLSFKYTFAPGPNYKQDAVQ